MRPSGPVGAVMVVGGGIGGMQAALDLADSGFRVYLVEEKPAIGGVMAQLDKTFPTNDCSQCILSPKLVAVGRHPNITLITRGRVEEVTGGPGDFTVKLIIRSPFVDISKCTGCGECATVCPVDLGSEFDQGLSERHAIYRLYPQAIPNAFTIDKSGISPCRQGCPAGVGVQAYVSLTASGRFSEALEVVRRTLPFPAICGRACHHPCEPECNRVDVDEPVAIRSIKRFISDRARGDGEAPPARLVPTGEGKVAIVGAGPAGLTCGIRLLEKGYRVTVFDEAPEPGGLMVNCLPDYRIPRDVARYDVLRLLQMGLEVRSGVRVGRDIGIDELRRDHDAVFIAVGAQGSTPLEIPGIGLPGVAGGMVFLEDAKASGRPPYLGRRVLVVGGGNVAIDCARTAIRFGCEVTVVYRRGRDEMPAYRWEVEEAEQEGVRFEFLAAPVRVVGSGGRTSGLECQRMELGAPDGSGRRRPVPVPGTETVIPADTVLLAIGQRADASGMGALALNSDGTVAVDDVTLETSIPGVFAGGDIRRGPSSIIEAVADGNEAAESIDRRLRGADLAEDRGARREAARLPDREIERSHRCVPSLIDPIHRRTCFDEVERCLTEEEAIREAARCLDCAGCSECLMCVPACKAGCIDHDMPDVSMELKVGSVVLAMGFEAFDARRKTEYGYGRHRNVLTSMEFERILSASGPSSGHVLRPSDGRQPRKVAWLQCVGSRDLGCGKDYCSSVCCTYAIKEAVIAKEHAPTIEPTIFFMDMRTFGKGFEAYLNRARDEHGVRFVRCRVSRVEEDPATHNLRIRYETEDGSLVSEDFDLVVLSVGLTAGEGARRTAERIGVELDARGFCVTDDIAPVDTSRDGVFVCGAFSGPKDIPETVMEASGAAARAGGLVASARGTLVDRISLPPEADVRGEAPRIGIFICQCGINIGGYVDVPHVVAYARELPNVVHVEDNLYTCSQDTQERFVETIREHGLNRVIVASCTPRTHEPLFQATLRGAGLNANLFEMANIRDQCSWVHMGERVNATAKACDLVRMAVSKAQVLEPLTRVRLPVRQSALVIGGGLAGMTAALAIAEQGFEVDLVEREARLGGNMAHIHATADGADVQAFLRDLTATVRADARVRVHTGARISSIEGYVGNYRTTVVQGGSEAVIEHGVAIVATGAEESIPSEHLFGKDPDVLTQTELERMIEEGADLSGRTLAFIQCVGSREAARPYCSRICCTVAVKNALRVVERFPSARVFVLYRDMRTYGLNETLYERARELGVVFVRYDLEDKPDVRRAEGVLEVTVRDPVLGEAIVIEADKVVLAPAIVPPPGNEALAKMLKVPLNDDGFFLEAHVKLRPVDFSTEGVFLAGMAHSPKFIGETIAQAYAAAGRACTIISSDSFESEATVAAVDEALCVGCGLCAAACPYAAIELREGRAVVTDALCKGCGLCAATCRSGAIQQKGFKDQQILSLIKGAMCEVL